MKPVVRYAEEHGWRVERRKNGHLAFRKGVSIVIMSATPSCSRAPRNALADIRRADRRLSVAPQ
jgi:hypothetical protein